MNISQLLRAASQLDAEQVKAIRAEIETLKEIVKPEAGNLRWDTLQKWLKQNKEWRERIKRYSTIPVDEAIADLKAYICERARCSPLVLEALAAGGLEAQAREIITTIQVLYRERKAADKLPKKQQKTISGETNLNHGGKRT